VEEKRRQAGALQKGANVRKKIYRLPRVSQRAGCTLRLEGTEEEVLDAAVKHAIATHGHTDNPELREQIRTLLKPA
jgi:predicted small metal-binding protein